ncbi:MAG: hypothetical protein CMP10_05340 [Zetaproteobacteria bacterium]|nr:hypothetical protein [Pseudobdellovibrionaceae bacterium]|tara:strand:+ start:134 stop:730 length:597 start_codon:yes stop_codon:yes gene_type:complete
MANRETPTFPAEVIQYVSSIRSFELADWVPYTCWIGSLFFLLGGVTSLFTFGYINGVEWPPYLFWIPFGTGMFAISLAFDDIGHRTVYKEELALGEGYVHQMISATAVLSVICLCLCYDNGDAFGIPAGVLIVMSFFYSMVDEGFHWRRYRLDGIDRVEMWAHFFAILGHVLMIVTWWYWYSEGYPGVKETLQYIPRF